MSSQYSNILRLTSSDSIPFEQRQEMLIEFAYEFQWHPSDYLEIPLVRDLSSAHIIVEHGLENTAVISFLSNSKSYSDLNSFEKRRLLSVSYNNLIDWHIHVERNAVTYVYNRTRNLDVIDTRAVSRDSLDTLRSENFDRLIGKRPNPNVPALDDALIRTISDWKKELSVQLFNGASNEAISALFNALIFVRAIEDDRRNENSGNSKLLIQLLESNYKTLGSVISEALLRLGILNVPEYLIQTDKLDIFDPVHVMDVRRLLLQFYRNDNVPYDYNFALMSKHALSRIYEHYVSVLRIEDSDSQLRIPGFEPLPEEDINKSFGSIYTPQYIARFFARYIKRNMPLSSFRKLKVIDPAVGSGIFLRTLLETQFDTFREELKKDVVENIIDNVFGVDIDENAVQATRLSLSLLNLVTTGALPSQLNIAVSESIENFQKYPDLAGTFDIVLANPPFVSLDSQDEVSRQRLAAFMSEYATGRIDTYLAFLRIGLELLKPGGYGLFVLPHSFLLSRSAEGVRKLISDQAWVSCLADLSAIRVFGDTGIYVLLLIFQKKTHNSKQQPPALVIKCQDLVGRALQDAIEGRRVENTFYSIYDISQSAFQKAEWILTSPGEAQIEDRFKRSFASLEEFLHVRVGFNSGDDDVFILNKKNIPEGEADVFVPFLADREMESYTVPTDTSYYFFYPFVGDNSLTEEQLRASFPRTWDYLKSHEKRLSNRGQVKKNNVPWWRPERPREPQNMMIPKIVSPHLTLVSRFALDTKGKYAISRAPLLHSKEKGAEQDLLKYFLVILNSKPGYWYIKTHSHTYRGGYAMLEPKTLKKTPVPDPSHISPLMLTLLLELADSRIAAKSREQARDLEREIDENVARIYNLSQSERRLLDIE